MKKISIKEEDARRILADFDCEDKDLLIGRLLEFSIPASPWWVIVLKVVAYAIGLIVAGYGTAAAACSIIY